MAGTKLVSVVQNLTQENQPANVPIYIYIYIYIVLEDSTAPPPVLNLATSKVLTEGHFGIFKKGPKFVPTPFKANFAEFKDDFELWKNKLRWAYHHQNKPESSDGVEDTLQEN